MKEFIFQCYEEYKKFVNIKGCILPSIHPVLQNVHEQKDGKSSYAYINNDEIGNDPINLYYSKSLFDFHDTFKKAILFHEFTHVFDGIIFYSSYNEKDLSSIMATYSEYHASQIELAYKAGFRNIHSCYKIDLSKTYIYSENQKIKIESDYIHPVSDALTIIEEPNNSYYDLSNYDYYLNYKVFEVKTMYYLGKKNFCKKYSLKNIPDLTIKWYGAFYPSVQKIEQCIINKDFDSLILARKGLFGKYFSTFEFHNLASLLEEVSFL